MPLIRTRLAIALLSAAMIALELVLMRTFSLRFWHHFAHMTISVALLGLGASGTLLTLTRERMLRAHQFWTALFCLLFAVSILPAVQASLRAPLDVQYLAWNLSGGAWQVLFVEFLLFIPFLFAGAAIGLILLDKPERIGGHYGANMLGSGVGAFLIVLLMHEFRAPGLLIICAGGGLIAGMTIVRWRQASSIVCAIGAIAVYALSLIGLPQDIPLSEYKMLAQALKMPDTEMVHQAEGPLGRIDVVSGPSVHYAPGLSLQYTKPIPPHLLLIVDGDQTSAIYDVEQTSEWEFMDHATSALAYQLFKGPSALIIGAGGGSDIGLAHYHDAESITALEMNPQIREMMTGPLAERGGDIYQAENVTIESKEARGFLTSTKKRFDILQLPAIDAYGASGAGLFAAQESYLYTVESFGLMIDRLTSGGVLSVTRWLRTPPRDAPRVLDTAAQALRRRGLDPQTHLVMIRSWVTATLLASNQPFTPSQTRRIREYCEARGFDLVHLPDIQPDEVNEYHKLQDPEYYHAAQALLSEDRENFIESYLFNIRAPTDNRPYFFNFFRWEALMELKRRLGEQLPAFLEMGSLMLVAALAQAVLLAIALMIAPLLPGVGALRGVSGKAPALGYFLLLGLGFMLLEMGLLQKLILYLAHPIYSASVVISGFLVFGGLGSQISARWSDPLQRPVGFAAAAIVVIALLYIFTLDEWLALTQAWPLGWRFTIAGLTIAPLALAMGHMFPLGLRRLGHAAPPLVPWAWATNGFASVTATVATPILAMWLGFFTVLLLATICYGLAGILFPLMKECD